MAESIFPRSPRATGWVVGLWLCLLAGSILPAAGAMARPQVLDVELVQQGPASTVQLMVDANVGYRAFTLASPLRLVVDLPAVDWRAPESQLERAARQSRQVKAVRWGLFREGTLRIVFDLAGPIRVESVALRPHGRRYALELQWRADRTYRAQEFGNFREVPIPPPRPTRHSRQPRPLVVIDPGHGGVDPGALGRHNTLEKSVTLAVAQQLARALRDTGRYRVVLTRNNDRFLPLRERMHIARRLDADLFLSLHADSAIDPRARGLSVYTLSDQASDAEAAALAKQENRADAIGGLDLSDEQPEVVSILIDLAQRETKNQSVRFANQLIQAMVLRVPVLDRPIRHAGFAVLKAPDVPAALIELGFLSHPQEERLLLSAKHRAAIIDGIVAATDSFFADRRQAAADDR
ncbi:MAG: N-acetylmuramoyl-L-alanine amidase [Alphaproteobacteria bacterium]|nr:N-acetylmuramoyl-L-alanine amidase [Alphaproteobacteria bacterium]MCB9928664.1 N-acetylmuramoyl-L-alanine amidase [Alphaproteobacteria bacterium]